MTASRSIKVFSAALSLLLAAGCGSSSSRGESARPTAASSPTAPTAVTQEVSSSATITIPAIDRPDGFSNGTKAVVFPPRNEALRFRQDLEAFYRDTFRRSASSSFVDIEGTIVWTQEYLRYRVNGCSHDAAVSRVLAQIDGGNNTATCGAETTFPPRNEPFNFRQTLEAKYRDGLRRAASPTFVDVEGDIVWTQEYLRYRTTGCSDSQATDRVRSQLQGGAPPSGCAGATTPTPPTTTIPVTPLTAVIDGPHGGCFVLVNCSFSGLRSTGAQTYQWTFAVNVPSVAFGSTLPAPTVAFPRDTVPVFSQRATTVRLTVRNAAGQTAEAVTTVTVTRNY